MRIALLADVHANLEALNACLAHARDQGVDALAFLGDLVGYGADPNPVLDVVAEHAAKGAIVVRGNHDEAALGLGADLSRSAAAAVLWTRGVLDPARRAFLESLPMTVRRDDVLFVHASAEAPGEWTYVTDPVRAGRSLEAANGARWVVSGHVHEPALYFSSAVQAPRGFRPVPGVAIPLPARYRWLAIAGSVGQPRDRNTAACWALLDTERATLTFQRVPYDWATAAAKVRAAGLPEALARRLERGE